MLLKNFWKQIKCIYSISFSLIPHWTKFCNIYKFGVILRDLHFIWYVNSFYKNLHENVHLIIQHLFVELSN